MKHRKDAAGEKMKIIRVLSCSVVLAASFLSTSHANNLNFASPLGMNTNEVMDMNSSVPFVDLFKKSAHFNENSPWLTKGHVQYDQFGWPKRLNKGQAGTRFISNLPAGTIPVGNYIVKYDGKGKIKYGGNTKLVKSTPGRDIIAIAPGKNGRITSTLTITESDPNNYIRNISVLFPGGICMGDAFKRVSSQRQCGSRKYLSFEDHHERILFNPDYLNFMKDFKVIRFMNMSGITRNDLSHWANRPNMAQASWGGKEGVRGVPLEVMVELANQLNADAWFNLPHKADNTFVQNYARYVKDHLKPNLKAYVEYTNEAWNGIFTQAHYMKKQGLAMKLDRDKDQAGYKYYSKRSVEVFKIWERVFNDPNRLVRVMGGFTTNKRLTSTLLDFQDAYKHTDALAIAPYFYIGQKRVKQIRDVNVVFRELSSPKNPYSIPSILKIVKEQAELTKQYNVDLIAYEGGQHLVAYKTHTVREGPNPALIRANKDRRMQKLYYEFLTGWRKAGGKTFVAFSAPRIYTWIGSWGIKEHINQPASQAPKYQALLAFNKNQPCWWEGCRTNTKPVRNTVPVNVAKAEPTPQPTRRLDPLDPLPQQSKINHTMGATPTKIAFSKPAEVFTSPKAAIQQHFGNKQSVSGHTISRVKNPRQPFTNHWPFKLRNIISGNIMGERDLGAVWQATWDNQYLHLKIEVRDDNVVQDSYAPWSDDSIEIFIDADGSKLSSYDKTNDFQLMYRLKDQTIGMGTNSPRRNTAGIKKIMRKTAHGYVLETGIPWRFLGVKPVIGRNIGIDIQINDDDNGQKRDGKLSWNARHDNAWSNPALFGNITLKN